MSSLTTTFTAQCTIPSPYTYPPLFFTALLYIVPTCLGTMFFLGRHDLKNLWSGARAIRLAERIIEKNERAWGKARMKRFVERRKREVAAAAGESMAGPDTGSVEGIQDDNIDAYEEEYSDEGVHSQTHSRERQAGGGRNEHENVESHYHVSNDVVSSSNSINVESFEQQQQPTSNDVCFGDRQHGGTIELQKAVKYVYDTNKGVEFNPEIFKSIRRNMNGRQYYCKQQQPNDNSNINDGSAANSSTIVRWKKARKSEIRDEVWKMYEDYRLYLVQNTSK
jgi:hypothetical protein